MPSASAAETGSIPSTNSSCASLRRQLATRERRNSLDSDLIAIERYALDHNIHLDSSSAFTCRDQVPLRFRTIFTERSSTQPETLISDVLMAAIRMEDTEVFNGLEFPRGPHLLQLRNQLLMKYDEIRRRFVVCMPGQVPEIDAKLIVDMWHAWIEFEKAWLSQQETYAVESFQPLVNSILAVESFTRSRERERLLPLPRSDTQRLNSVVLLVGVCRSLQPLTAVLISAEERCLFFDPVVLLLAELVQSRLHGTISPEDHEEISERSEADVADNLIEECLDMAVTGSERLSSTGSVWSQPRPIRRMKSLNSSTQIGPKDSRIISCLAGLSQTDFTRLRSDGVDPLGCCQKEGALEEYAMKAIGQAARRWPREKQAKHKRSVTEVHRVDKLTASLLRCFDQLINALMDMKGTLEFIPVDLAMHPRLPTAVIAFNAAYRRAARLYMEPDSLL